MTADPTTLRALADRIEAAEHPGRQIDEAVVVVLGWTGLHWDGHNGAAQIGRRPDGVWWYVPPCTGSIDAAASLVPEGWAWQVGRHVTGCGHAYMHNGHSHFVGIGPTPNPARRHAEVRAATPALALTAAALRARAAMTEGGA